MPIPIIPVIRDFSVPFLHFSLIPPFKTHFGMMSNGENEEWRRMNDQIWPLSLENMLKNMKVGGQTSTFQVCIVHFLVFWGPGKFQDSCVGQFLRFSCRNINFWRNIHLWPRVLYHQLSCLLINSDTGLWDVLRNQEVADFVIQRIGRNQKTCEELMTRWVVLNLVRTIKGEDVCWLTQRELSPQGDFHQTARWAG